MHCIKRNRIYLRTPLPQDIDSLLRWENHTDYGSEGKNFSREEIERFVLHSYHDIYLEKQLRWMIGKAPLRCGQQDEELLGCIDLFDFDEHSRSACIGILIADEKYRNQGFASEALSLLIRYCFGTLYLYSLNCKVSEKNTASMKLFRKHGFCLVAHHQTSGIYSLQLLNPKLRVPA